MQLFLAGVLQNDFALLLRAFQLNLESRCAAQTLGQLLVFNRERLSFGLLLFLGLGVLRGGFELAQHGVRAAGHAAGQTGQLLRQLEAAAPGRDNVMQLDFETVEAYNNPSVPSEVVDKLHSVDIETLTPLEALNFLYELKTALDKD